MAKNLTDPSPPLFAILRVTSADLFTLVCFAAEMLQHPLMSEQCLLVFLVGFDGVYSSAGTMTPAVC